MRVLSVPGRFPGHFSLLLVILYACIVVAWTLLLQTPISGWWPVQLAEVFHVWLYLPLLPLILMVLLTREWRTAVWLVLPLAIFGLQYGQLFLPSSRVEDGSSLRVITANLQFENRDVGDIAALLSSRHPDVVGVQELGTAMAGPLGERMKEEYPYQALYPSSSSRGMGILSRYPIVDVRPPEMADGQCNCQQATIDVKGQPVTILNVHPNPPNIRARRIGPLVV